MKEGLAGDLNARQKEYSGEIFDSGQHLLSLINDILDLSKIEAGKMTLELEKVELPLLLEELPVDRQGKGAGPQYRLEDQHRGRPGRPAMVDVRKFKQMVYNLLANAVKFTPDGGSVILAARAVPPTASSNFPSPIPASASPKKTCRAFSKPFEQLDSSLARKYEGTGLGLSMVKRLAELHGGTVGVRSELGKGSRFTVRIPLRTA